MKRVFSTICRLHDYGLGRAVDLLNRALDGSYSEGSGTKQQEQHTENQ
jgi:hypothetical protein